MPAPRHFEERVLAAHMEAMLRGWILPSTGLDEMSARVLVELRKGVSEEALLHGSITTFFRHEDASHTCYICGKWSWPYHDVRPHLELHRHQVLHILGWTTNEPSWEYTDDWNGVVISIKRVV